MGGGGVVESVLREEGFEVGVRDGVRDAQLKICSVLMGVPELQ